LGNTRIFSTFCAESGKKRMRNGGAAKMALFDFCTRKYQNGQKMKKRPVFSKNAQKCEYRPNGQNGDLEVR